MAVVRNDRLVVPRGDTVLQAGDEVLALVIADANARSRPCSSASERPPAMPRNGGRCPLTIDGVRAAFFDLDKTVIAKASIAAFSRPFRHGGLLTRRVVLRAVVGQLLYLQFGADEERLTQIRESVLAVTRGWDRDHVPPDRPRDLLGRSSPSSTKRPSS